MHTIVESFRVVLAETIFLHPCASLGLFLAKVHFAYPQSLAGTVVAPIVMLVDFGVDFVEAALAEPALQRTLPALLSFPLQKYGQQCPFEDLGL